MFCDDAMQHMESAIFCVQPGNILTIILNWGTERGLQLSAESMGCQQPIRVPLLATLLL
jgi:hypothetical protein